MTINRKRLNIFDASKLASRNTRLSRFINKLVNNCQVDKTAIIGDSLKLSHCGVSTVIGKNVRIGNNVHIYHNVTIGTRKKYTKDYPTIEDNVTIYPGSIIIGAIIVGEGSVVGAHSLINKSVPAHSIVFSENKLVIKKKREWPNTP